MNEYICFRETKRWFAGFTRLRVCVCVCGEAGLEGTAVQQPSHAMKRLHRRIPFAPFGLGITVMESFRGVGTCSQRSWSAVRLDEGAVPKPKTNDDFPGFCNVRQMWVDSYYLDMMLSNVGEV